MEQLKLEFGLCECKDRYLTCLFLFLFLFFDVPLDSKKLQFHSFFSRWEWQVTLVPLGNLSVKLEGSRWELQEWILSYQPSQAWRTVCLPSLLTSRVLRSPVCPIWWVVSYCLLGWLCIDRAFWILGLNGLCSVTGLLQGYLNVRDAPEFFTTALWSMWEVCVHFYTVTSKASNTFCYKIALHPFILSGTFSSKPDEDVFFASAACKFKCLNQLEFVLDTP